MAAIRPTVAAASPARWGDAAQAMFRAAQAVSHPSGPTLFAELVRELASILQAATVFIATYTDDSRQTLRTLAAQTDGRPLHNFDYAVEGSPCASVVGRAFRYVAHGVAAEFPPGTMFRAKGMDAYAAFPLSDSAGAPLGLLVAMDRRPTGAMADAELTEALLKIFAGRIVAELERGRVDESLRTAALAVSSARGESVFAELARYLATALHVDLAFIARHEPDAQPDMHMLAMALDGRIESGARYALASSPCAGVLGQGFRVWPERLRDQFPDDGDAQALGLESYAGQPINDSRGRPLGTIGVASRRPLAHLERVESMLQIFAVRAAAELEQLQATEALRRSEASYRAIFESAEVAIFVHDWDTGALLDVNPKACQTYGYTREELLRLSVGDISSGVPPYTAEEAWRHMKRARLGRCPPLEWQRRNKDGSLHWDEVRLKPVHIDGKPHVLAYTRDITEHKQALEALQAREEQYRAVFDASVDALTLWDSQLRRVDVNPAYETLYGWSRAEVIGRGLEFPPLSTDDVRQRAELVRRALAGETVRAEHDVVAKNGERRQAEVLAIPFRQHGQAHALVIARDITERKRAEQALRTSEEQYRAIFDASADALILWDSQYRRVDVNPAFERLFGWSRDEVIGRGYDCPDDGEEYAAPRRDLVSRALAGETCRSELASHRKDGTVVQIEVHATPFRHLGEPHVLAIARDISERKRSEQALRNSEEQYRSIFNASADAMVLRDAEFRIVDVNDTYERMSGYSRDEVLGEARVLANPPEVGAMVQGLHARALAGEAIELQTQMVRRDGGRYELELRGVPIMHRGQPHVLYIGRDITRARHAEAQRAELERQLRQAQKMEAIGQLSGGIAHDFNNILTSVIGYLALAGERAEMLADATLQRQLGASRQAAQRARDLVAQLLAFARRQRGERLLLTLAPLVEQVLQLLRSTLPASVVIDAEPASAAAGEADLQVLADPVQLEQVLFNLCINARDAIAGPGVIRIRTGTEQGAWRCASCRAAIEGGRWVAVEVADSGRGILPEVVERMFEPFYSTKEVGRGSGMGLAMVHGIVHEHGGHVEVRTHAGAGTRFRVLLPRADEAVATAGSAATLAAAPARATLPPATRLAGRVLVVEDETMVGELMAELLANWGLDVQVLKDPLVAAAWLEDRGNAVDLLITDQTMPRLTGLQLARQAVAARPGLPVLLYTGHADAVAADDLTRHGVRALMHKPVDPDALRALVRDALRDAAPTAAPL